MDVENIRKTFKDFCEKLRIKNPEEQISKLVTYLMIDGTRTSTNLNDEEAYMDGAKFSARFLLISKILGCEDSYVNVFEEFHRFRGSYHNIYPALLRVVPEWKEFTMNNDIRLKFVGKLDKPIEPEGFKEDLRIHLKRLEELTKNNKFGAYIFINFNREYAEANRHQYKDWPTINAVIRFTKGLSAPESMWLPGKIRYESLIYVQQGSSSINWSDRQLVFLIALALRAISRNPKFSARASYTDEERERIRKLREKDVVFVNEDFYDKELDEGKDVKVAMIFTEVGPERYKF